MFTIIWRGTYLIIHATSELGIIFISGLIRNKVFIRLLRNCLIWWIVRQVSQYFSKIFCWYCKNLFYNNLLFWINIIMKFVHTQQHCCWGMCKILWWWHSLHLNYNTSKFLENLWKFLFSGRQPFVKQTSGFRLKWLAHDKPGWINHSSFQEINTTSLLESLYGIPLDMKPFASYYGTIGSCGQLNHGALTCIAFNAIGNEDIQG